MKKLMTYFLKFLLIPFGALFFSTFVSAQDVTPILIEKGIVDENGCGYVGDPYIYDGECSIGINRYISRSATMGVQLTKFNSTGTCWGVWPNGNPSPTSIVNCQPPYDLCWGSYCPNAYANSIQMLIDLKIQLVSIATSTVSHEFKPGEIQYEAAKQLIVDINSAYDCAGLRRPIVQAAIWGLIEPFNNNIPIPAAIINEFKNKFSESEKIYYLDATGNPRPDRFFDRSKMLSAYGDSQLSLDITLIESKLWFFHQAKEYINMGYHALHMGIHYKYSRNDEGYTQLYDLLNRIRSYCTSVNSFVIMNGENEMNAPSAKLMDTDYLLFDFDGRAMRPREISNPQVYGDGGCGTDVNPDFFNNTPCDQESYPAIVDACTINSFGESVGGISPLGCYYEQVPYYVYFDWASGIRTDGEQPCPTIFWDEVGVANGSLQKKSTKTWGFDDSRWFGQEISQECKIYWWNYFYCDRRNYHSRNGFLQIPGIVPIGMPEQHCNTTNPISNRQFVLGDPENSDFLKSIKETLTPLIPSIKITEYCSPRFRCERDCFDNPPLKYNYYKVSPKYYDIELENIDCSSTYSIHIKKPDGSWAPQTLDVKKMNFYPSMTGLYTIGVRQDNLALPGEVYTYDLKEYLGGNCCEGPYSPKACFPRGREITVTCTESDKLFRFELQSPNKVDNISSQNGTISKVANTDNSFVGFFKKTT